jgi:hypothetical protein
MWQAWMRRPYKVLVVNLNERDHLDGEYNNVEMHPKEIGWLVWTGLMFFF